MSFLRHDLFPLIAALLAALAVLFVSTASMAYELPVTDGQASMSMGSVGDPCEPKPVKVSCQKACLVLCQGLIPQGVDAAPARVYAPVRYAALNTRHTDFTLEADDPPPRT